MFRQFLIGGALLVATTVTSTTGAEPFQASAGARALAGGDAFGLSASSGHAVIGVSRRQAQLVLRVESLDVLEGGARAPRLPSRRLMLAAGSTFASRAIARSAIGSGPLLTLFDHVEERYPNTPPEHVTVGLDYRFVEDEDMAFEVAEAGAIGSTYASHNLLLTARFSF